MIPRKDLPDTFDDVEKPYHLVAESADGAPSQPLAVRVSDLWTDLMRVDDERDRESAGPASAMPFLDYMKGIMQWD